MVQPWHLGWTQRRSGSSERKELRIYHSERWVDMNLKCCSFVHYPKVVGERVMARRSTSLFQLCTSNWEFAARNERKRGWCDVIIENVFYFKGMVRMIVRRFSPCSTNTRLFSTQLCTQLRFTAMEESRREGDRGLRPLWFWRDGYSWVQNTMWLKWCLWGWHKPQKPLMPCSEMILCTSLLNTTRHCPSLNLTYVLQLPSLPSFQTTFFGVFMGSFIQSLILASLSRSIAGALFTSLTST